jgi:hypothetical protein
MPFYGNPDYMEVRMGPEFKPKRRHFGTHFGTCENCNESRMVTDEEGHELCATCRIKIALR